jgi:hypothetical protein
MAVFGGNCNVKAESDINILESRFAAQITFNQEKRVTK